MLTASTWHGNNLAGPFGPCQAPAPAIAPHSRQHYGAHPSAGNGWKWHAAGVNGTQAMRFRRPACLALPPRCMLDGAKGIELRLLPLTKLPVRACPRHAGRAPSPISRRGASLAGVSQDSHCSPSMPSRLACYFAGA